MGFRGLVFVIIGELQTFRVHLKPQISTHGIHAVQKMNKRKI